MKCNNYALVAILSLGLGACATTDPYTGEQKTNNTSKGAVIGAVAGAVIGAATASDKDRNKGILTGAAAGGALGAGAGNYMDRQEAKLRQELRGSGVRVARNGDNIQLIMPGNVTFDVDQANIRSQFFNTLASVAVVLKEFDKTNIRVTGYTDSTGSDSHNQVLSENRADAVGDFLVSQGIASGRVQARGYGERYPVASNDTPEGREANRRVELELVPVTR